MFPTSLCLICSSQERKKESWCSFDVSLARDWSQAASQLAAACSTFDTGHASAHQLGQHHSAAPEPMQFPGGFRVYVVNEACHVQGTLSALDTLHSTPDFLDFASRA